MDKKCYWDVYYYVDFSLIDAITPVHNVDELTIYIYMKHYKESSWPVANSDTLATYRSSYSDYNFALQASPGKGNYVNR